MSDALSQASNWEQGSLLPVGSGIVPLQWAHAEVQVGRTAKGAVKDANRRLPKGEVIKEPIESRGPDKASARMMVTTQSCDLVKLALPQFEVVRLLRTSSDQIVREGHHFGSARYYWLSAAGDGEAWVVDFAFRALLDKGFLTAFDPDNGLLESLDQTARGTFSRWLGQRYSRPAIPDEDYAAITAPVRQAWENLRTDDHDLLRDLNEEYGELRYRRESNGDLTLYMLSAKEQPDQALALELSARLTEAIQPGYPGTVRIATDRRSFHTFTKADELSTNQINMEWASHDEPDGTAALPPI